MNETAPPVAGAGEWSPTDNILHLTDCEGCERCDFLMGVYLACDGCGEWGHKESSHRYEMVDGEVFCERCQEAASIKQANC